MKKKFIEIGRGTTMITGGIVEVPVPDKPGYTLKSLVFDTNRKDLEDIGEIKFVRETENTDELFDTPGDVVMTFRDDKDIDTMIEILKSLKTLKA